MRYCKEKEPGFFSCIHRSQNSVFRYALFIVDEYCLSVCIHCFFKRNVFFGYAFRSAAVKECCNVEYFSCVVILCLAYAYTVLTRKIDSAFPSNERMSMVSI